MHNSFKTLILSFTVSLLPLISFAQINYSLSVELGQTFAGIEKKSATEIAFNYQNAKTNIHSHFSPSFGLVHDFSFGEKQRMGLSIKMQFEQVNFSRRAAFTRENETVEYGLERSYQLNRLQLPVELFYNVGKLKFSAGIVNTWSLRGEIDNTYGLLNQLNESYKYVIGENVSTSDIFHIALSTTYYQKKYNLQSTVGVDFQLSKRWQIGTDFRFFLTKSAINFTSGGDILYFREFKHQTNSVVISLSYLLFGK